MISDLDRILAIPENYIAELVQIVFVRVSDENAFAG